MKYISLLAILFIVGCSESKQSTLTEEQKKIVDMGEKIKGAEIKAQKIKLRSKVRGIVKQLNESNFNGNLTTFDDLKKHAEFGVEYLFETEGEIGTKITDIKYELVQGKWLGNGSDFIKIDFKYLGNPHKVVFKQDGELTESL